jgi:hypothetical protein
MRLVDKPPYSIWRQKSQMESRQSNSITRSIAARRCASWHIMPGASGFRKTLLISRKPSGSRKKSSRIVKRRGSRRSDGNSRARKPHGGPASPGTKLRPACGGGGTRAGISQTRQGDSAGSGRVLPAASSGRYARLPLGDISEQFARSREQSGLSPHYVFLCRKFTRKLAESFPGLCLSDLTTAALDNWLGNLKLGATTKNECAGCRAPAAIGRTAGTSAQGHKPVSRLMRYKEEKAAVSIFTPEQIASLLKEAGAALRPYWAALRRAPLALRPR